MALTAVIPRSFPDLHMLIYAYKVVGLQDIFSYPAKEKESVVLVHRGRSAAHRDPSSAQSQVLGWSGTVR